jgi:tripartite-type tricarboxylate transporter receptor subunit TctC
MEKFRRVKAWWAGIFLSALWPGLALAAFPDREITIYCGSSAGGVTDICLRVMGEAMSKDLGQPIVVINKPGASHTACANLAANSKPDGYSLGGKKKGSSPTRCPKMNRAGERISETHMSPEKLSRRSALNRGEVKSFAGQS